MYKPTVKEKRKTSLVGWRRTGPKTFAFGYDQQGAIADSAIKPMPGRQNKHGGTWYKRKRRAVKLARRRNR